jgi:hypothetical protein
MDVAGELGYFVNSFSWKGAPPRSRSWQRRYDGQELARLSCTKDE